MGRAGSRQGPGRLRRVAYIELHMRVIPRAFVVLAVGLPVVGCTTARSNTVSHLREPESDANVELSAYFPQAEPTQRTFLRTNPSRPEESPTPYGQTEDQNGRVEGSLTGRVEWPLSRYLDPHSNRPERARLRWPIRPRPASEAFFVEFNPPVTEWPEGVRAGAAVEWQAEMSAYDRRGVPFAQGSAVRRVVWEGYETVGNDGAAYPDCLRLHVETDLYFGWWASIRLRETVWLAQHIGIVRRIERLSGHALLLLRFDSAHEYNLQAHGVDPVTADASPVPPRRWARLAIHLDRSLPRPRVGGLAVEWAGEPNGAARPGAVGASHFQWRD